MQFYLEKHNWPKSQYGFRKGYNTTYNVTVLTTDIFIAFTNDLAIETVFLDIHKAYDPVIPEILIETMSWYAIPSRFQQIVYKLITDRIITLHPICNNTNQRITNRIRESIIS